MVFLSPQSHGRSRRVTANQTRLFQKEEASCFAKLRSREVGARLGGYSQRHNSADRFRNFSLQAEFDAFDCGGAADAWRMQYLHKRAKIVEIVACQGVIFALAQSGACAAFDRVTGKRLCYMNTASDEVIRSLFFNKHNQHLITVSVYSSDNYTSLRCRTTSLEFVRWGKPELGIPLFHAECLKWPGFVEFDDVNCKILTYSAVNKVYRVYDLRSYELLYSLGDKSVTEVKISPGIMLVIYNAASSVPLKILNIEDGSVLKDFSHKLTSDGKIDFIEQFNEKLLVKQEGRNLQVLDVRHGQRVEVKETEHMTPTAFIFLYENQLFLTFKHRTVAVWNFRGELVTSFEDHDLWYPDAQTNNIYITHNQSLILSYCKGKEAQQNMWMPQTPAAEPDMLDGTPGSINVSSILTGKLVAKISAVAKPRTCRERRTADALTDVTALFFDEERNEIYTGNAHGHVQLWSN